MKMVVGLPCSQVTAAASEFEMATLNSDPHCDGTEGNIVQPEVQRGSDPANEGEDEEESIISDPDYRCQCRLIFLTYHAEITEVQFHFVDDALNWGYCHEKCKDGHTHTHCVYETKKRFDRQLKYFTIGDSRPNAQCNRVRGKQAYGVSRDCLFFYITCKHKIGYIGGYQTWCPNVDYIPRPSWIDTMWKKQKLKDPIECAEFYVCITEHYRRNWKLQMSACLKRDRESSKYTSWIRERRDRIAKLEITKQFKSYPELFEFKLQFEREQLRYKFLYLWSYESKLGKGWLIRHNFPGIYEKSDTFSLNDYNPDKSKGIVFHDVPDIHEQVLRYKDLFVGFDEVEIGVSNCNQYSYYTHFVGVPVIITSNLPPPEDAWFQSNMIELQITTPTYE